MFTENANQIFRKSIADYHRYDDVDRAIENPYAEGSIEHLLYMKNWIDTVQWHLEDIIRDPQIDPCEALKIKRRIDKSNQDRTDMVEYIDSWMLDKYRSVVPQPDARINTETPAWAIDRLSILALKIWHMACETERTDVDDAHREACRRKLAVLEQQQRDLSTAIEELIEDIEAGRKYMKTYKQMKMYNDPALNPVLYAQSKKETAPPPAGDPHVGHGRRGDAAACAAGAEGGLSRTEGHGGHAAAVPALLRGSRRRFLRRGHAAHPPHAAQHVRPGASDPPHGRGRRGRRARRVAHEEFPHRPASGRDEDRAYK